MANVTSIQTPLPNIPIVNPDGTISRQFLYWVVNVQTALGGNTPTPIPGLIDKINALFVEEAFSGSAIPNPSVELAMDDVFGGVATDRPSVALSMDDVMGGSQETDRFAASVMLGQAFSGDAPTQTISPILAALLVSDYYP